MGKEKQKEKDVAVRHQIISEINTVREHLKNIGEILFKDEGSKTSKQVKFVIDELDLFAQEAEFSEVGHSYPMFSPQRSAGRQDVKKVKNFDKDIIEQVKTVEEACKQLETALIDKDESIDAVTELQKIRQFITDVRAEYKHRMNRMKEVK